jgi:ferritin-like metal-binding protein YciE
MPKAEKTLQDLFEDSLKDIYFAEKKILTALPKMAKAAQSPQLQSAFEKHLTETEGQVERIEQMFELLEMPARGKNCPAILGIVEEGSEIMKEFKGSGAIDAGLVGAAKAVEHYEIVRYTGLKSWAEHLGHSKVAQLLDATLREELKTDETLTRLAPGVVEVVAAAE